VSRPAGPGGTTPLRVRLLGGLEVEGVGEQALGTRKARTLLRRLAVAGGRPVAADELAAAVWGDDLPRQPGDQLSVLVSRLRGVLGTDRLVRGDGGYRLVADWIDVADLEGRCDEIADRLRVGHSGAALAAAQAALGLVRGPLLPEEDGAWVGPFRASAERLAGRLSQLAAEAALAVGEPALARAVADEALARDPFDEAALRLRMRADVAAGRPAAALAVYDAARIRLARDLGVDPAEETRALHLAVLRDQLTAQPTRPALVGRSDELRRLDAALRSTVGGNSSALVVEAAAGLGKSALLDAWSARAAQRAVVASGRADELGRDLPLQPVVDAIARLLRGRSPAEARRLLGNERPLLDPLLGRRAAAPDGMSRVEDAEAGRAALFADLAAVLERARGERPLVVLIDDLHLAGAGTAEFLSFLLARLRSVLVVAARRPEAGPDLPSAERLTLGPLSVADAVELAGPERGRLLHEASGGHPLFLAGLARSDSSDLPPSIVAAVRRDLDRLGAAGRVLRTAAMTGPTIDPDLLGTLTGLPVGKVLDAVEAGARAGLLVARGDGLAFAHELVRSAAEETESAPVRAAVHRRAAEALARRPDADPLAVAHHARLAGARSLLVPALVDAAEQASARQQREAAERLLDEALSAGNDPRARLARGRLRLARLDLDAARADAQRAIEDGAGAAAFELAGWIAYYARDYPDAQRYADEGAARSRDLVVRTSCLALSGRLQHTAGHLAAADARLADAVAVAPPQVRGVAQLWRGQLLLHLGRPEEALDSARRGLLDPHVGHPFAPLHGRFTVAFAHALAGRWSAAMAAVDDLGRASERLGDRRFPAVTRNLRGWLLRGAGLLDPAAELHGEVADALAAATFFEQRYAALLDLTELCLAADDLEATARALDRCAGIEHWRGSMSWRHGQRYRLLRARLDLRSGAFDSAVDLAEGVAAEAGARGDLRYAARAGLVVATAHVGAGAPPAHRDLARLLRRYQPLSGPDGWRELGELAAALGSTILFARAERIAAGLVAAADGWTDAPDGAARAVRAQLERWRP
jgi:DNA-binding SARP family transcriptional activator